MPGSQYGHCCATGDKVLKHFNRDRLWKSRNPLSDHPMISGKDNGCRLLQLWFYLPLKSSKTDGDVFQFAQLAWRFG